MGTHGYPAPAPETLARRIDAAVASISQDRVGVFLADIDRTRATAAVMLRVGDRVKLLAQVTRPHGGQWEGSVGVRVDLGLLNREPPPPPPMSFRDYFEALRAPYEGLARNSPLRAAVKAAGLMAGRRPYLDGGRWFAPAQ